MPEKKPSPKLGRPKILPKELDDRYQIRCSTKDIERWTKHADEAGYGSLSAWIRKVCNTAVKQLAK